MTRSGTRAPADPATRADQATREIGGRMVRVSHPERVVWPRTGTMKADLIDYLLAVSPVLLPHLRDRATMLWRFPEGVEGPGWFQAQCRSRPDWVPIHEVLGRGDEVLRYCVIQEPATLAWLANLGTIVFHPHLWRTSAPSEAASLVFDLDPGPPAGLVEAARVALAVEQRLTSFGLDPLVKTSGSLGLHVVVPLAAGASFEMTKAFGRQLAEELADARPGEVVARSGREARSGRVYVDWVQNDRNRQLVAPYSPRATPLPGVSTPLTWDEVRTAADGQVAGLRPTLAAMMRRLDQVGDLWAPDAVSAGRLPRAEPT